MGKDKSLSDQKHLERQGETLLSIQRSLDILQNYWLIFALAPVVAGLLTYTFISILPGHYTSIAYLRINRTMARSAEALMRSPDIAGKALKDDPTIRQTAESQIRYLDKYLKITDINASNDPQIFDIYRLSLTHPNATRAQKIASRLITAWLATTGPGPIERKNIEDEIALDKNSIDSTSKLIERLQGEANHLLAPNSWTGELATPLSALMTKRAETTAKINQLERRLIGVTRDVIVSEPHLPQEPASLGRTSLSVLAALTISPLILIVMLFGRAIAYLKRPQRGARLCRTTSTASAKL